MMKMGIVKMRILENETKKLKRSRFQNGMHGNGNSNDIFDPKINEQNNGMKMRIFLQINMPYYTNESPSGKI